jgi:hypothetical protein
LETLSAEVGLKVKPQDNFKYTGQVEFRSHINFVGHIHPIITWSQFPFTHPALSIPIPPQGKMKKKENFKVHEG